MRTPGCAAVGGLEHRGALVRLVDRVLLGDQHRRQRRAVVGVDQRDLLPGRGSTRAVGASVDSVIGIGQNRPLAMRMPSQTPCQSACDMKPSSGVKPPMPSMMMSPRSRELTRTRGMAAARARSRSSSTPSSSRGLSSAAPCGRTRLFIGALRPGRSSPAFCPRLLRTVDRRAAMGHGGKSRESSAPGCRNSVRGAHQHRATARRHRSQVISKEKADNSVNYDRKNQINTSRPRRHRLRLNLRQLEVFVATARAGSHPRRGRPRGTLAVGSQRRARRAGAVPGSRAVRSRAAGAWR